VLVDVEQRRIVRTFQYVDGSRSRRMEARS
jgi:hypothetical protein